MVKLEKEINGFTMIQVTEKIPWRHRNPVQRRETTNEDPRINLYVTNIFVTFDRLIGKTRFFLEKKEEKKSKAPRNLKKMKKCAEKS